MLVKKEFLNRLKDFGLNSYEAKLWTSLLSRGISSAGELSDIANVPRSRTYDVLESLEKKGFIVMKIGKPIKYIAVPPEEVIERVKKKIKQDAAEQTQVLDDFKGSELLGELNLLHSQGVEMVEPTDLSGALKGRKNVYNHMEYLANKATDNIVLMASEEGLIRKHKTLLPALEKAKKKGVSIQIASKFSKDSKIANEYAKVADLKHTDHLEGRFMVADNAEMVMTFMDGENTHPTYDSAIWLNSPFIANTFGKMFSSVWDNNAKPHK